MNDINIDPPQIGMTAPAQLIRTTTRSFPTKLVRGGTRYTPTRKDVIAEGPSTSTIMETSIWRDSTPVTARSPEEVKSFPSITFLQGCVDDKSALVLWQKKQIEEKGMTGFRKMIGERAGAGTSFHKSAASLISQMAGGSFPSLEKALEEAKPCARGYVESLYPFLAELSSIDTHSLIVESKTTHHQLMFSGRFDAVFKYKGSLCMVDWKTAQTTSAVSRNVEGSQGLSGLYGYPRQLAAYVSAFNSDPVYADKDKITTAAIVLAYDNGEPAKVIEMNSLQLLLSFSEWCKQLDKFWRAVEAGDDEINMISK